MEKTNDLYSPVSEDHLGFTFSFDGTNIIIKLDQQAIIQSQVCKSYEDVRLACSSREDLLTEFRLFFGSLLRRAWKRNNNGHTNDIITFPPHTNANNFWLAINSKQFLTESRFKDIFSEVLMPHVTSVFWGPNNNNLTVGFSNKKDFLQFGNFASLCQYLMQNYKENFEQICLEGQALYTDLLKRSFDIVESVTPEGTVIFKPNTGLKPLGLNPESSFKDIYNLLLAYQEKVKKGPEMQERVNPFQTIFEELLGIPYDPAQSAGNNNVRNAHPPTATRQNTATKQEPEVDHTRLMLEQLGLNEKEINNALARKAKKDKMAERELRKAELANKENVIKAAEQSLKEQKNLLKKEKQELAPTLPQLPVNKTQVAGVAVIMSFLAMFYHMFNMSKKLAKKNKAANQEYQHALPAEGMTSANRAKSKTQQKARPQPQQAQKQRVKETLYAE